jgi:sodium-dependent dicarboxylate transporter 2/3/5
MNNVSAGRKALKLAAGPFAALLLICFCDLVPYKPEVTRMAAVATWMAIWWLTEVVHLAVTALLPVILLPLLGIADSKIVAGQYMDPIIFLFIGGFMIAFAIEKWHLHQRIALRILMKVGTKPSRILLGVMLTSYLISMWISNTATVMMLLSAVMAVILQLEKKTGGEKDTSGLATALLIGLAYSATIGGMATLVGTPTNMIFFREYTAQFSERNDVNFLSWFVLGFPLSMLLLFVAYFILSALFLKKANHFSMERSYFSEQYKALGKMSYEEKIVSTVFVVTATLWFTRADLDLGDVVVPGWSRLFPNAEFLHDSTAAILMAVLLFLIPSRAKKGEAILEWDDVLRLPFDIVLLFGGGFAMAKGCEISGLTSWLSAKMSFASGTDYIFLTLMLCLLITVISEFASNVTCIQIMIPIVIAIQQAMGLHPLSLLIPATLAASLGFMLPVATAPNTIVFGSRRIRVKDMLRAGFFLNLAGILLITLLAVIANEFLY